MRLGQPWTREVVPGVFRLGTTYVGWYAIEDAGAFTFIDTGLPGYWSQMVNFLASRGAALSTVKAVVLTHHHVDHKGNAERLRDEAGVQVLLHQADVGAAMGKVAPPRWPLWKPRLLHYFLHCLRYGVMRVPPVVEATSFADGEVLDVPARPRVLHTPGHTPGSAAMSLEASRVLVVGDALATIDLVTGARGPRLLPRFQNDDPELALASLRDIEKLQAEWVLPGHGPPWEGSPREAVARARQAWGDGPP